MLSSLKPWINLDAQIRPFIKRTGTGTKLFEDSIDIKCYAVSKIVTVTDNTGAEVISSTHLYVDGDVSISVQDRVIFEGLERDVLNVCTYYRNGKPDIRVVYMK